jgi:hypothetical protein
MTSRTQSDNKIQIMTSDMQKYYQKARGMDATKSEWMRTQILLLCNATNRTLNGELLGHFRMVIKPV